MENEKGKQTCAPQEEYPDVYLIDTKQGNHKPLVAGSIPAFATFSKLYFNELILDLDKL